MPNGKRWTQEYAAEKMGLTVGGYRIIELGHSWPQEGTFDRLCTLYGVPPQELLYEARSTHSPNYSVEELVAELYDKVIKKNTK